MEMWWWWWWGDIQDSLPSVRAPLDLRGSIQEVGWGIRGADQVNSTWSP